jgi:hypothetical protein
MDETEMPFQSSGSGSMSRIVPHTIVALASVDTRVDRSALR